LSLVLFLPTSFSDCLQLCDCSRCAAAVAFWTTIPNLKSSSYYSQIILIDVFCSFFLLFLTMTTEGEKENSSINGSGRHASPHQLEAPPQEQRIQEDYTGTNAKMIVVLPQIFPSSCAAASPNTR